MKNKISKNHLYRQIASNIEGKIETKVLRAGDRLPSVRILSGEYGVSLSTILEAYYYLEGKGLIESRPRSGYFVRRTYRKPLSVPSVSDPGKETDPAKTDSLVSKVFSSFVSDQTILFSVGVPALEFIPIARLNKEIIKAVRTMPGSGTHYETIQGNERLRHQLAMQSLHWDGHLLPEDLVITTGCMEAISLSLMVTTRPGETIATESPVYFGLLQLAQSLGRKIIELPTDPEHGVEIPALKERVQKGEIQALCLISNFNNPLGSCISSAQKKEITEYMESFNIPIIEDDIYGDLYFESARPLNCKTFDHSGNVLLCGSISKTLAPGYRVGWVAPGRFKEELMRQKLYSSVSSASLTQEVIASFFETGRYENHLRKLRSSLYKNSVRMINAIADYFPEGTKVSHPKGGFMLWIELDRSMDTAQLYDLFKQEHISIAPGRMFTLQNQYNHCMRLSYGLVWNQGIEKALFTMGKMLKSKNP